MHDEVMPTDKWEFDEEVTSCFDNMLERSIPGYQEMRDLVTKIGSRYAKYNTAIVDIGCSNGNAIAPFVRKYGGDFKYLLLDASKPMVEECKKRFGYLDIREYDITNGLPDVEASVVLSILTLQFTPIEYRFVIVEKVLGNTEEIDSILVDEYYQLKAENAYTKEQIAAKRKSLEGVLVPITAKWNEQMLHDAGFTKLDCFWRYLNFAGWVAIK